MALRKLTTTIVGVMGLNLPIDCERLNWLERRGVKFESTLDCEELDWLFLPLNKRYLITKIEDVEENELLIHCRDDFGHVYVVHDCSFEFLDHMRKIFSVDVDVSWHQIRFIKTGTLDFHVLDFHT